MLVPNLTWLVIEDAYETNDLIENILIKSGIKYYYMVAPMPSQYKAKTKKVPSLEEYRTATKA
ncbi:hypothetical protein NQ318_017770 [Aromia moschata]|uniref:Galactosylgalactosylxylosylprotein 3-beta-glucuronosyltransferase n=1 Tax=Aromia moschata TaxID=1265417 RepID=A0AAV8XVH5_9CUCU|nr:hypothetical protein NQ318_017770 [Aromia moschata]